MATVYPTAAGNWSTRTWNNDATGAAYGMAPQTGDTVLANNVAITLDTDITVVALSTRAGTTAAAGGSFTTSGTRTINADTYAGSSICLTLTNASSSVQNGNSYGSITTNSMQGTSVGSGCTQNGNSFGQNGSSRAGTNILNGGTQNGNSTGGSASAAHGSIVASGGVQIGNATGGTNATAYGSNVSAGGWLVGDSVGGTDGPGVLLAGTQVGSATGGSGANAHGTVLNTFGGLFYGNATGSSTHDASGVRVNATGGVAIVDTATGGASNRYGVLSTLTTRHVVIITTESGTHPKSLGSGADTTYDLIPFADPSLIGGGGASESVSFYAV